MRIATHVASPGLPATGVTLGAVALLSALVGCDKDADDTPPARVSAADAEPIVAASARPSAEAPDVAVAAAPDADTQRPAASSYEALLACCTALHAAAKPEGPAQTKYTTAAAVCSGIARQVKKGGADLGSARTLVRAQLSGLTLPSGC